MLSSSLLFAARRRPRVHVRPPRRAPARSGRDAAAAFGAARARVIVCAEGEGARQLRHHSSNSRAHGTKRIPGRPCPPSLCEQLQRRGVVLAWLCRHGAN